MTESKSKYLSDEQTAEALTKVRGAVDQHVEWCDDLYATLACRITPRQDDLDSNAHQKCGFGQWLYSDAAEPLHARTDFASIDSEHEELHRMARKMLSASQAGDDIAAGDFRAFRLVLARLRMLLNALLVDLEEDLSQRDHLTGALTRDRMLSRLREQADLVERHVHPASIAMLDIDEFKQINDKHGHTLGDEVLAAAAHYLLHNLRSFDALFRYGGDEFLICAPGIDLRAMHDLAARLCSGIASLDLPDHRGGHIAITVSIGLAEIEPQLTAVQCIEHADHALYIAKTSGRNRVAAWEDPTRPEVDAT